MARGHSSGRRRGGHAEAEESNERWLLTYADMITLLMALFMVLFSISSVNISKYKTLQKSLRAAFSGNVLPGGRAIAQPGASSSSSRAPTSVDLQAVVPVTATSTSTLQNSSTHGAAASAAVSQQESAAQHEQNEFAQIKRELDAYASKHGFGSEVKTTIESRGLVIKVLTDDLLFPSGQATLDSGSDALLDEISRLLNVDETHPIDVEGNTDNVPIHSAEFPSNWELSTARASSVVEFLIKAGVAPRRLTATGNADQRPVDTDATAAGRARNRRVEIVLRRIHGNEDGPEPAGESEP